ncbi:THTPA [Mytilus coruscus]|uniref:THTPA n=1 Tax=Mytilus coruscus TaxID=42192 RepID=A0A6J8CNX7_MYTCO|nr:THTPA [Mytilus coruscus]
MSETVKMRNNNKTFVSFEGFVMAAKGTELSLDINGEDYIDRVETKIESPKAEVITPNSDKMFSLSMENDEGSSVDGPLENGPRACDDNELKDESWVDHCETKIIADDHLKYLKEILTSSVTRTIKNDKIDDESKAMFDSKKSKRVGSYEITSATSFFLFNTANSKKSTDKRDVNTSPVKVKEKQVSMLYQMGVEAIGKPLEPKTHEEYPLQLADDDSSMQNAALATEDSRSTSAKAGWASIRQESGELENYLLEEDDDENVIIHLGLEFDQDTIDGGKNEVMAMVDFKDQYEETRQTGPSSTTDLPGGRKLDKKNLAEEEDTSLNDSEENKTYTSDKLSQLENVFSNMSQEDSLQTLKQEQRASSVEKHAYKTQVSAESKNLNMKNSDIENIATEDKTFQANDNRIHTVQFGKSVQKCPSQVLSTGKKEVQTNIGKISESQSQEHLTDEKITRQQTEQLNLSPSIATNAQDNSKQFESLQDTKVSNEKDSMPQMKQIEVERKFRISSDCRQKLMDMGAVMAKENKFSDKYFDDIRYKMTLSDSWLRQRNGRWEFKIPPRHMSKKDSSPQLLEITSETEIMKHLCKLYNYSKSVEDITLDQLMNELSLDIFATFTTIRQTYYLPNCTVELDIADFGFEVGEIEVVVNDESRITDAVNIIDEVAKKLELKPFKLM